MPSKDQGVAERIARAFHEAYEDAAPRIGYETRPESAVPWDRVPETNKALMIATVGDLLDRRVIAPAGNGGEGREVLSGVDAERLQGFTVEVDGEAIDPARVVLHRGWPTDEDALDDALLEADWEAVLHKLEGLGVLEERHLVGVEEAIDRLAAVDGSGLAELRAEVEAWREDAHERRRVAIAENEGREFIAGCAYRGAALADVLAAIDRLASSGVREGGGAGDGEAAPPGVDLMERLEASLAEARAAALRRGRKSTPPAGDGGEPEEGGGNA